MFKRMTLAFMLVIMMVGCDRVGDGSDNIDLIPEAFCWPIPTGFVSQ